MKNVSLLLVVLYLTSCNKERTLHISAINPVTNLPYSGLTYYVVEEKTGLNGENYTTVATGSLDNNGEIYVDVKIRKNRSYVIRVERPSNNCYFKEISYSYAIQDDKNPHFKFEFAECAYMKQNIKNLNCEGPGDKFSIRDRFSYSEWSGWSFDIMGCFSNTGGEYFKVPEGKRYFNWRVTRSTGTVEFLDSVDLKAGEYGQLDIYY